MEPIYGLLFLISFLSQASKVLAIRKTNHIHPVWYSLYFSKHFISHSFQKKLSGFSLFLKQTL